MSALPQDLRDAILARVQERLKGKYGGKWSQLTEDDRKAIYGVVVEELLGKDRATLAAALTEALADDKLTQQEVRAVLLKWAKAQTAGTPVAQQVIAALEQGPFTLDKVIEIARGYLLQQIDDPKVKSFLETVTAPGFHADTAWDLVVVGLQQYPRTARIADQLAAVIREQGEGITRPRLLLALMLWTAATDQQGLDDKIQDFVTDPTQAVTSWIVQHIATDTDLPADDVKRILDYVLKEKWVELLGVLMGALNLPLGRDLIAAIDSGNYRKLIVDQLSKRLAQLGVDDGRNVAAALLDLLTGARSLFAQGPESDATGLRTPSAITLFRRIRRVIYLTQMAVFRGPVVPTSPTAPPHVFLAAKIRYGTKITELLPKAASEEKIKEFCNTLTEFLDKHFEKDPKYRPFLPYCDVLDVEDFQRPSDQMLQCSDIYGKVANRLSPEKVR